MIIKNIFKYSVILSFLIFLAALFLAPHFSLAQEDNVRNVPSGNELKPLEITYPTIPGYGTITSATKPNQYIRYTFIFGLWVLGIAALINLIHAGALWFLSGASSDLVKAAQKKIMNTLFGVFLLLATYLIFNTINPDLLNLKLSNIFESLPDIPETCSIAGGQVDSCDAYNNLNLNDKSKAEFCANDYCQVIRGKGVGKTKEPKNSLCFWDQIDFWNNMFGKSQCKTITCNNIKTCEDYNSENLPDITTRPGGWGIYRACILNVCSAPGLCIMDKNDKCTQAKGKIDQETGKFVRTNECVDNNDKTCAEGTVCNEAFIGDRRYGGKEFYLCKPPGGDGEPCKEKADCQSNLVCAINTAVYTVIGNVGVCMPESDCNKPDKPDFIECR